MACSATKAVHHSGVHVCALRLICPDVQLAMPRFLLVPHSCTLLYSTECSALCYAVLYAGCGCQCRAAGVQPGGSTTARQPDDSQHD